MSRRSWPALDILIPGDRGDLPGSIDRILAALDDHSPSAIDDSVPGVALRAYFTEEARRECAFAAIAARFGAEGVRPLPVDVPDEGWAERSQAALEPITVGRVIVTPPWHRAGATPGRVVVTINPSMGFGTGHHQTTRLCLDALQQVDLAGREVTDIGTGSGVLAIAAVRLGAAHAIGLDSDPDAVASARENVVLNGVTGRVTVRQADFRDGDAAGRPDVAVANLTGPMLVAHAAQLISTPAPGGTLIVSGFSESERDGVARAFEDLAVVVGEGSESGWGALRVARRS